MSCARDVILFATADWDTPYWTNKQHTAVHLAKLGYRVLYVDSPGLRGPRLSSQDVSRIARRLRRGLATPRQVSSAIWVLSPLSLPYAHDVRAVQRLNQGWLRSRIRSFVNRKGMRHPLVWTYHPYMLDAARDICCSRLVYHCVDDLSAVPGIHAEAFRREEERLLVKADIVFTSNTMLRDRCALHNANTHYFPNVVDYDHFARARQAAALPADLARIPEPRIAYIGVLSDFKVDFPLLLEAAKLRPDWSWVFVGDEREGQHSDVVERMRRLPNVHMLGFRPYAQLPEYLRGIAVGLIPSLLNDYTRSMFPMKFFEYLAAGVPVVATPLQFALGEPHCAVAADAPALVEACERSVRRGRLSEDESRAAVGSNTWEARLQSMLALIGSSPAGPPA